MTVAAPHLDSTWMPTFCRHGTLTESCPICRASVELAQRGSGSQAERKGRARDRASASRPRPPGGGRGARMTIRHETRSADDGFRTPAAPGLRSSADAQRLAEEIAHASARLTALVGEPPGLYAQVASEPDLEEATWLALLIAYIGPLEPPDDPFETVGDVRTGWQSGELPDLAGARLGPRSAHDEARGDSTLIAYRRWAERAGSQERAIVADPSWSDTQRFERAFGRLSLPGLDRRARYDLLVTLGALGRYQLTAPSLLLSEDDSVSRAAKRVFGIGDRLVLERRVAELAEASAVPVAAFDLALENWAAPEPIALGLPRVNDAGALERARAALGV
jgi:hypothetical protein